MFKWRSTSLYVSWTSTNETVYLCPYNIDDNNENDLVDFLIKYFNLGELNSISSSEISADFDFINRDIISSSASSAGKLYLSKYNGLLKTTLINGNDNVYGYRGMVTNNYFKINDLLYRIITIEKADNNFIYLITEDSISCYRTPWNEKDRDYNIRCLNKVVDELLKPNLYNLDGNFSNNITFCSSANYNEVCNSGQIGYRSIFENEKSFAAVGKFKHDYSESGDISFNFLSGFELGTGTIIEHRTIIKIMQKDNTRFIGNGTEDNPYEIVSIN